jgi:very-short-patch-repair endonuclease
MTLSADLAYLLQSRGLVVRREHPELAAAIDYGLRSGNLTAVLPGVYAAPSMARLPRVRMRAVCLRHPNAVLLTEAAAQLSFWPQISVGAVQVAVASPLPRQRGFAFTRRRIPPELVEEHDGLRFTSPALTAIDLSTFACTDGIDRVLLRRAATLPMMHEALARTANRIGNPERLRLLLDSRDLPWSAAERLAHNLLRRAGIRGWKANLPVFLEGSWYYVDIAFRRLKVAIEIDGRLHEDDEDLFQSDRWRQNALVRDGWRVLRFTWEMLCDHPEAFVAAVRAVIA